LVAALLLVATQNHILAKDSVHQAEA